MTTPPTDLVSARCHERDQFVHEASRSPLWPALGAKPLSIREALFMMCRVRQYERVHGPIPPTQRVDVTLALILRGRGHTIRNGLATRIERHWRSPARSHLRG